MRNLTLPSASLDTGSFGAANAQSGSRIWAPWRPAMHWKEKSMILFPIAQDSYAMLVWIRFWAIPCLTESANVPQAVHVARVEKCVLPLAASLQWLKEKEEESGKPDQAFGLVVSCALPYLVKLIGNERHPVSKWYHGVAVDDCVRYRIPQQVSLQTRHFFPVSMDGANSYEVHWPNHDRHL